MLLAAISQNRTLRKAAAAEYDPAGGDQAVQDLELTLANGFPERHRRGLQPNLATLVRHALTVLTDLDRTREDLAYSRRAVLDSSGLSGAERRAVLHC